MSNWLTNVHWKIFSKQFASRVSRKKNNQFSNCSHNLDKKTFTSAFRFSILLISKSSNLWQSRKFNKSKMKSLSQQRWFVLFKFKLRESLSFNHSWGKSVNELLIIIDFSSFQRVFLIKMFWKWIFHAEKKIFHSAEYHKKSSSVIFFPLWCWFSYQPDVD